MSDRDIVRQAVALAKAGRRDKAHELLRQALQENADNVNAWVAMAQLSRSRVEAIYCLQQVLRLRPGNTWATTHLRRLSEVEGQGEPPGKARSEETAAVRPKEKPNSGDEFFAKPSRAGASDGFPFEPPPGADAAGEPQDLVFDLLTSSSGGEIVDRKRPQKPRRRLAILIISLVLVIVLMAVLWGLGVFPR